jgi:hypothetical protein
MKSETENTIEAFITEDGTVYTPCETSEAEGLWSNGKFIEVAFSPDLSYFRLSGGSYLSSTWQAFGAIPVKKVVPKKEPLPDGWVRSEVRYGNQGTFGYDAFRRDWGGTWFEVRQHEKCAYLDIEWRCVAPRFADSRAAIDAVNEFISKIDALEKVTVTEPEPAPELDLSPLTKEEFWQLQPLDTVTVPELDGLVTIRQKDEAYWGFRGEHNALPVFVKCNDRCSPTPETAKRLRGKVTK